MAIPGILLAIALVSLFRAGVPAVIAAIIDKAGVKGSDVVLEVGPGTGTYLLPQVDLD